MYFYTLLLSSMVALAMYRSNKVNVVSFWFVGIGSILFAISDSSLAIDLFLPGHKNRLFFELVIMISYYVAQLFIYNGAVAAYRAASGVGEKLK